MILKSLMEEKQLDFNQPLLSVRRFSSTVASENDNESKTDKSLVKAKLPPLPAYKSELKSGPVSNPGTVPFVWEKTPGRPKDESKLQTRFVEWPSITPRLPPGRVSKVEQRDSDKAPKGTSFTQSRTGSAVSSSQGVASLDNKVAKHESIKEIIKEKESSGSDDGDEAYQDALDTLSRAESFFMTCSVSGLSGWDDQEVQPSACFSADQQARDFMIGRFLPAAKAMASETPQVQYTSRKPPVTQEQTSGSRQMKKIVTGEKSRPLNQKWRAVLPHYAQDIGREESEDESDDNSGSENYAPKVCGLFPRFCLLNPIPGLRMEDRIPSSPVHGMQSKSIASRRRTVKEHARTGCYGKKSVDSQSGTTTQEKDFPASPSKSNCGVDPHRRGCSELLSSERTQCESSCESPVVEKTLYVDSVQKIKHSISCSSEMNGPTNHRGDDFLTSRKDTVIDKNPAIGSSLGDSKHLGFVNEKETLQPKSSASLDPSRLICTDNSSYDMLMEITNHSNKKYFEKQELMTKPGYLESHLDHNLVFISSPKVVDCKKIESESQVSVSKESSDGLIQNPVSRRNLKLSGNSEVELKNQRAATKLVSQECNRQESSTWASSKVEGDGKKFGCRETSNANSLKLPLSLPLPKAPSESWLKRTLPAVSSRSNVAAANVPARTQTPRTASVDPKWEDVVKSSNVHHRHLRLAEEPLAPIPEA